MRVKSLGFDVSLTMEAESAFTAMLGRMLLNRLLRAWRGGEDKQLAVSEDAVYDEASVQSQHAKSFGNFLDQIKRVHSDYLARRLRRIGERAEQIKNRPDFELAARGLHKFHGRVHRRSKEKRDPDFFQAGGQAFRRKLNVYAESFHHIRRTFFRAHAAVAMLGYAHAGARDHERCCGRDVKRRAGRTAGATGIDERLVAGAADVHCRIAAQV